MKCVTVGETRPTERRPAAGDREGSERVREKSMRVAPSGLKASGTWRRRGRQSGPRRKRRPRGIDEKAPYPRYQRPHFRAVSSGGRLYLAGIAADAATGGVNAWIAPDTYTSGAFQLMAISLLAYEQASSSQDLAGSADG